MQGQVRRQEAEGGSVTATKRNVVFPDVLWQRIEMAAAKAGAKAGKPQPTSEWVRSACEQRLEREARTAAHETRWSRLVVELGEIQLNGSQEYLRRTATEMLERMQKIERDIPVARALNTEPGA